MELSSHIVQTFCAEKSLHLQNIPAKPCTKHYIFPSCLSGPVAAGAADAASCAWAGAGAPHQNQNPWFHETLRHSARPESACAPEKAG